MSHSPQRPRRLSPIAPAAPSAVPTGTPAAGTTPPPPVESDQSAPRLLCVEDVLVHQPQLPALLRSGGYEVRAVGVDEAVAVAQHFRPDAVVLGRGVPPQWGVRLARRLRRAVHPVPAVVRFAGSTAPASSNESAEFDASLPYAVTRGEVMERLRLLLAPGSGPSRLRWGPLMLEPAARRATRDGRHIRLTRTESAVLKVLMQHAGQVVDKPTLLDEVWHYDFGGKANVVELYVSYLRKKIDRGEAPMIHTVRNAGYILRLPTVRPAS